MQLRFRAIDGKSNPCERRLQSWVSFFSNFETPISWKLGGNLLLAYNLSKGTFVFPWRNSSLDQTAFEDIAWNCTKCISVWTEGRPLSPFGSLSPGTGCQFALSDLHLLTFLNRYYWTHVGMTLFSIQAHSTSPIWDSFKSNQIKSILLVNKQRHV